MSGRNRLGALGLVALILTWAACSAPLETRKAEEPAPSSPVASDPVPTDLEVSFGVSAPFSQSRVTITADGKLSYQATVYPPAVTEPKTDAESKTITKAQLQALWELLSGSSLFEQAPRQDPPGQDCISYGVSVKTGGKVRAFGCECGCPEGMTPIRDLIQELLGHPMMIMGF